MEIKKDANGEPFMIWGNSTIKLERGPLTLKEHIQKAETELRETPEIREKGLRELRELLRAETGLVIPIDDDEFLLKFLRPCKFYAESAFKGIQSYYKFRKAHAEYCHDLIPSAVKEAFSLSIVSVLAPRDQHGRRIMLVESGAKWNPREISLVDVFRGVQLALEGAMAEPCTQVNGVISILDMKGLSLSQVMHFTPSFAKLVVDWIQDCVPIRLKAVHIINQPYIFNMLFAIFKPFLRQKLRSRIHFHGSDRRSFLSHVDAGSARKRHGGSLPEPDIPGEMQWAMLNHYEEAFKLANSYGYVSNNNK